MTVRELFVSLGYKVDDSSKKKAVDDAKALKSSLTKLLSAVGITISLAGIIKFGNDCKQAASDVEQMEQKFDVVFDNLSKQADQWAGNLADSIGRSKNSIKTYLADSQNLFVGFGMEREAAMELSKQLTESAIDIASFANLEEDAAVNAMTKAVLGQSEAAKSLGAVLNDNTIAMSMNNMGIKGNFAALDEVTKMQVRYNAIMMQSQDSIGDAARSMGSYESNNRKFLAQIKEIKEIIGKFLLPFMNKGLGGLSKLTGKLKDGLEKLGDVNEEGTKANQIWTKFTEYCEKAKTSIDKIITVGKKVIDMLGGGQNALKLLGVAFAAFMAWKAGEKVAGFAQSLKSVSKALGAVNLKALLVIAVIVLLVLAVQDFIYFLQGKDSLFGTLLENAGIDVEATREKFISFKDDIAQILGYIKKLCQPVFDGLKEFWEAHGAEIMAYLQNLVTKVIESIGFILAAIAPFVSVVVNLIKALFAFLSGDTEGGLEALRTAWESFKEFINTTWQAILSLLDGLFGGLPSKALEWGKDMLQNFIDGITEKIAALKEKVLGVGNIIKEKLHFSKPDNGPLADSDTWMPDMMDLFAKGIETGKEKLKGVVTGVAGLITGVITGDTANGLYALAGAGEASPQTIAGMSGGSSYNIVQNNNFNNTFNGGEREMQTQASRQMNRDARDASTYLADAIKLGR